MFLIPTKPDYSLGPHTGGAIPIGHTIRGSKESFRITYHPDWSPTLPWRIYWRGSCVNAKGSLWAAMQYGRYEYGVRFAKNSEEYLKEGG
jgi:hypothetical protein